MRIHSKLHGLMSGKFDPFKALKLLVRVVREDLAEYQLNSN